MTWKTVLPIVLVTVGVVANGCGAAVPAEGDDIGKVRAPEFKADRWLNTDKPISIKDLKGQVVLLDFWTYCCINCMHIFPDLHFLEEKYKDKPVVVIGVHSGKFDEEKDADHIRQAVLRHNIMHPVAVDSDMNIWNEYGVQAWPTLLVIDPKGYVVAAYSGEGHREQLDRKIAELLKEGEAQGTLAKPMHFKTERESFKSGTLEFPGKVLADAAGKRLFISDTNHNRVLVADLEGKVSQVIGSGSRGLQDGGFAQAQFYQPQGLALSADGKTLFVADTENHALRAADLSAHTVVTLAGTGKQAREYPEDSVAKTISLSSPWALARVGEQLYIAMAGVHQIWVMDLRAGKMSVYAGTGREADRDGRNDVASFAQPSGLSTDGTRLFVADSEASSIRAVGLLDRQTRTIAGSGDLFGFGLKDGVGAAARFQHPLGVAVDGNSLFVADTFNSAIRKIDLKTDEVTTWLGGRSAGGNDASASLYEPGGLSVAGGTLYVADTNHHRILAIDMATKKARVLPVQVGG